jgi:hypothetical protein
LWIDGSREVGAVDEAREGFQQILKLAILFGGMAIFYIWIEAKLLRKWQRRKGKK